VETDFEEPDEDNIAEAMNRVAETLSPTLPHNTNTKDGEYANKQVLLRATENDHGRWKQCADILGISVSEFIRNNCNRVAQEMLECTHPLNLRKTYPWSEFCLKCNTRLR
jgi:uncharacterized protein (DUF1778 family)